MSFSESCRQVQGNRFKISQITLELDSEWTREGSLKSSLRVDADGNLDRYLQECMMVHD